MPRIITGIVLGLGLVFAVATIDAHAQQPSTRAQDAEADKKDGMNSCAAMMQGAGITEDGPRQCRSS